MYFLYKKTTQKTNAERKRTPTKRMKMTTQRKHLINLANLPIKITGKMAAHQKPMNEKNGNGNKNNFDKKNERPIGAKNIKSVEVEEEPPPSGTEENPENVTLSQILTIEKVPETKY